MKRSINDNNNNNTQSKKKIVDREAIYLLCREGKIDELKEILDSDDTEINMSSGEFKKSPLVAACNNDHVEVARLIIDNSYRFGGNLKLERALENACHKKSYAMVKLLIGVQSYEQEDIEGMIQLAVEENDPKLLQMALDNKLNSDFDFGRDPISVELANAAAKGSIELVKLIVKHNTALMANIIANAIDTAENSECAVDQKDIDKCVEYLKKQKAELL